jgi:hypothetical protein
VFVLGAGASVHAGAPVMATFLENAKLLSKGITQDPWKSHFERVFKAINDLQRVHSKAYFDIHNLEAVFTILETARTVGKLPGFKAEETPGVLDSFKNVITYTLDVTTEFPVRRDPQNNEPIEISPSLDYKRFVQLIQMLQDAQSGINGVSIITFNYDIALDFALRSCNVYPDYCLPNSLPGGRIKLLKLHGSLNWGRVKDTDDIRYFDQIEAVARNRVISVTPNQAMTNLLVGTDLPTLMSDRWKIDVEPAPVIVPPGFYKAEYHEALKEVWRAAAEELSDAEDIIVIGFSLPTTDSFFNHLYALGTEGGSTIRKFWVFNPEAEGGPVENRFKAMLGFGASPHFHYFPLTFDAAVSELVYQYYGLPIGMRMGGRNPGQPWFGEPGSYAPHNYSKVPLKCSSQVRP